MTRPLLATRDFGVMDDDASATLNETADALLITAAEGARVTLNGRIYHACSVEGKRRHKETHLLLLPSPPLPLSRASGYSATEGLPVRVNGTLHVWTPSADSLPGKVLRPIAVVISAASAAEETHTFASN